MNQLPSFGPFAAGDRSVSADVLNELVERVRGLLTPEMGTLLDVGLDYAPQVFVARISEVGSGADAGKYGFVEQRPAAGPGWEDRPNGIVGTVAADPARGLNGADADPGELVVVFPGWHTDVDDHTVWRGWQFFVARRQVAVLRVLSAAVPGVSGYGMYPARLQAWVQVSPSDPGTYQDANTTTVFVRDPDAVFGAAFMPGEYVCAKFVGTFNGVGGAGDLYERLGLGALWLDGPTAGLPFPGFAPRGYPETRQLSFSFPFYFQNPANPSYQPFPGRVRVGIAASTADSPGVLLGVPGGSAEGMLSESSLLGLPPPGGFGTDPWRTESNCQWARGGNTGFTFLSTNLLALSDGQPPTTGLAGQTPPDVAFAAWSSGGFATLGAGHGHFGLGVDGQGRLDVYSPGGNRGYAKWGTVVNPLNEFDVYTSALNVSAPGLNDLLVTFAGALEVTSGSAFCWVNAPHHGNVTGIGNAYGSVTAQPQAGLLVTSPIKVSIGGIVELGFGAFSQTRMVGQNYVYPEGGGGAPGANLRIPAGIPNSTGGYAFYNGLYLGGLDWIWGLRQTPGTSTLYTPPLPPSVDMHAYPPPGYTPPAGPTYPTYNPGGFWSTLHVEYD